MTSPSNRDPDARYETMAQGIPFFGDQLLKRVHTCLPGIVIEYDYETRRARVQPAVNLLLTDGTTIEKPIILDVPVIYHTGGGYTVHFPLIPDDPVMLLFSERDIATFKETLTIGPPLSADIMEIQHALCVPGFVFKDIMLAHPDMVEPGKGFIIQTNDGQAFIHLLQSDPPGMPGGIDITANNGRTLIHMEDEQIYATVDGGPTHVTIVPAMIYATVDDDVTHVHMEAGHIRATPDSRVTEVRITPAEVRALANSGTSRVVLTDSTLDATVDNGVTHAHMEAGHIRATPDSRVTEVRITPAEVRALAASGNSRVVLTDSTLDATVDNNVTSVHVEAGMIRATPDSGTTLAELQAGQATITAAAIAITGVVTATGNVDVTGNIGVTGTVDGVDVSTHTHGGVRTGGGRTGGPS